MTSDREFLFWVADRFVNHAEESGNVDFVQKLRAIAAALPEGHDTRWPRQEGDPTYAVAETLPKPAPAPPAGVRVLRVLEYTYRDAESAETDMARWMASSPPENRRMRMRSAALPFVAVPWEES